MSSTGSAATAAVLEQYGEPFAHRDIHVPELRDDEVLVRIAGVGICHTDLTAAGGGLPLRLPTVLGHEGAGVVEAVGEAVTALAPGDEVVLGYDSCRRCRNCTRGRPAYCRSFAALNYGGTRADGSTTLAGHGREPLHGNWFGQSSFATHAVASARNAVRVGESIPVELAGPLGCGIATGAGTVLRVLRPGPGSSLLVVGLGAVGMAAVMAGRIAGAATIVGVDPNPRRLALAGLLGADVALTPDDVPSARGLRELADGGFDFAVETVGSAAVVASTLKALASPGVCATVGLRAGANPVTIDQTHLLMGRTLTGVIEGDADPHEFLPELMRLWAQGALPVDKLIRTYPFARIDAAVDAMRTGATVKPVLTFDRS